METFPEFLERTKLKETNEYNQVLTSFLSDDLKPSPDEFKTDLEILIKLVWSFQGEYLTDKVIDLNEEIIHLKREAEVSGILKDLMRPLINEVSNKQNDLDAKD